MKDPTPQHLLAAARVAVTEDLALGDVTTAALIPAPYPARATIIAREEMTVAGIAVARQVFHEVDAAVRVVRAVKDGSRVKSNAAVLIVEGEGRSLLAAERAAVNFLQHLSGIATLTHRFCAAVKGYRAQIVDTRKTLPGLRALEKWAVALGGGRNHRQSLGDGILIKDNHLALLRARGIGPAEACRLARQRAPHGLRIIIEAQTLSQVREAVDGGAEVVLLDNMTAQQVREACDLIKGRALSEVSGGITLHNVAEMAAAGADLISIGALTHSAPAADLSMDIAGLRPTRKRRIHGIRR
jgi:nicotinate-nucleotide pyrophosphorylase (carboxylating)